MAVERCALCGGPAKEPLKVHGKAVCGECFTELFRQSLARAASISERRWLESSPRRA